MSAEDALIALEEKVLSTVRIGGWLAAVADLRVLLATESPGIRRALFALYAPKVEASALAAVAEAFGLGRADALDLMGDGGAKLRKKTRRRVPSKEAREPVKGLDSEGVVALAAAYTLARAGADPATFLAPVFGHADRIQRRVSDAINRGGNEGATVVADAAGVPTVWVAERNACVHCLAYAGQVCDPGKAFPGGLTYGKKSYYPTAIKTPPRHPRCLPFDAVVTPGSNVTGASAREYDGEMVRIKTLSGNDLTGTPNHPVLTRRGWVGLGLLEPGDEVVSRVGEEGVVRRGNDREHVPALIGELAQATLSSLEMAAREVPLSAVDFHGDGGGSEVGVVATDRMLQDELDRPLCEHHRELLLEVAARRRLGLASGGGTDESLFGDSSATHSVVSSTRPSEALLGGRPGHAEGLGLLPTSTRDAVFGEAASNDRSADAESIGDADLALAGQVAFDQVVDVDRYAFHGMVYNLETEGGWYIANGIITHNCRCTVEPLNAPEYAVALKREAQRSILRGISLESESMGVRIDATKRLLASGVDAPKSVISYAEKSVRAGRFETRGRPKADRRPTAPTA